MARYVFSSFNGYSLSFLRKDLVAGITVAALTIPVAMGYATVAGLPAIYGLYGSILPLLGYVIFASSSQLIVGIEAAASAVTGSILVLFGVTFATDQAIAAASSLAFFSGVFLVLFSLLKFGRFAKFVSLPVMSGFISGLGVSVLLDQVVKIAGLDSGGTTLFSCIAAFVSGFGSINPPSLIMGFSAAALILLGKKFIPQFPLSLLVMIGATVLTAAFSLDTLGVGVVGTIPEGLPPFAFPDFSALSDIWTTLAGGFIVAIVVFASSIIPARSFSSNDDDESDSTFDPDKEVMGYGVSNLLAAFSGCSATNASMSRTAVNRQIGGKTQVVSLIVVICITLVVLFVGNSLYYMPTPVLGGIVFAAVFGTVDIAELKELLNVSRNEAYIWLASGIAVLLVGVLVGVVVGIILSFVDVIMRLTSPPQSYLGVIPGREGFFELSNHKKAKPVPKVAIFRFSAPLFFGNIDGFRHGVLKAIGKFSPKLLIIDASGINSIDATAAEELGHILALVEKAGVECCFAGQTDRLKHQIKAFGLYDILDKTHMKMTINEALAAFPVEEQTDQSVKAKS